jgi:uncharacterized hydrophobic protein (TIGR00271 family)
VPRWQDCERTSDQASGRQGAPERASAMRQLTIRVPRGEGGRIADIARGCGAGDIAVVAASAGEDSLDLVTFTIGNERVESVLGQLDEVPDAHVSFYPRGVIALRPQGDGPGDVVDVQPLSPIEVYLSGLQSVGSWKGFLGYAVAAGVVVWIGLFTERAFLLVAAMLIAPFAGPAMNAALGTARGDFTLFRRSLGRYVTALLVTILTAFVLSVILRQQIATGLMISESMISSVAILLPLTAGAAGALNLCQSERNSLVAGAATGMLIAASLAPPAGIFGMALAIGEWPMITSAAFLLLLQIAGINLSGAIVFRIYGISPKGARFARGSERWPLALGAASLATIAALFAWQMADPPNLQRSSTAQRAAQDARQMIDRSGLAKVVTLDAQFTRADIEGQNTLLVTAYVQPSGASHAGNDGDLESRLEEGVKARLASRYNVSPVADVTILRP